MRPYYKDGAVTIYHGDSRTIVPTLGAFAAVITDPPYGIGYETVRRLVSAKPDPIANDAEPPLWAAPLIAGALLDSGAAYVFTRFDVMAAWNGALEASGLVAKTPIIWDKGNWTAGDLAGDYGCQTELILFYHKGRHLLRVGRDTNLWRSMRPAAQDHPTPKPVGLFHRAIANSTNAGDTVLDLFMGTAPVLDAAKALGRKAVGIDIEERWCETAALRLSQEVLKLA